MHYAIRKTTAALAVLGALGIAYAEGGPGDSGVGAPDGSASTVSRRPATMSKKVTHKAKASAKRASDAAKAASGT